MNTPKTDEEKKKFQAKKMFDIAEKPVMRYISSFLEEDPSVVFTEPLPEIEEPIISFPIKEYDEKKYIRFSLDVVKPDYDFSKIIDTRLLNTEQIKKAIGFISYCVKSVYVSVIMSGMINKNSMVNVELTFDEETLTFRPVYSHELIVKRDILEKSLAQLVLVKGKFLQARKELDSNVMELDDYEKNKSVIEEKMVEVNTELNKVTSTLNDIQKQIVDNNVINLVTEYNNKYKNKPCLGIIINEMLEHELPPITRELSKGEKNSQILKELKPISETKYEDPDEDLDDPISRTTSPAPPLSHSDKVVLKSFGNLSTNNHSDSCTDTESDSRDSDESDETENYKKNNLMEQSMILPNT